MRYRGKNIYKLNVWKELGKQSYLLVDEATPLDYLNGNILFGATGTYIEVDTKCSREIEAIRHRLKVNAGCGLMADLEISPSWLYKHCRKVSWNQVPEGWQRLFEEMMPYMVHNGHPAISHLISKLHIQHNLTPEQRHNWIAAHGPLDLKNPCAYGVPEWDSMALAQETRYLLKHPLHNTPLTTHHSASNIL